MAHDHPGPFVVRTSEGATVTLPGMETLRRWLDQGWVGPDDRLLGGDGRWRPLRETFPQQASAGGPGMDERWPDAPTGLRAIRLSVHRRRTEDLRSPSVTLAAPVQLGH